jgi:hypothetical protein
MSGKQLALKKFMNLAVMLCSKQAGLSTKLNKLFLYVDF